MADIRSYMHARVTAETQERKETQAVIATLREAAETATEKLGGLKALVQPVLTMYDGLGGVAKATITRLMPNLASALDKIREALAEETEDEDE